MSVRECSVLVWYMVAEKDAIIALLGFCWSLVHLSLVPLFLHEQLDLVHSVN